MSFFNFDSPIAARKRSAFEIQDAPGLWRIHWQVNQRVLISTFYTRHDQACLLWGAIAAGIFVTAQFLPFAWTVQALLASVSTIVGIVSMSLLTWYFVTSERITWVLGCWAALMLCGAIGTDLAVFFGWMPILINICPLWLWLNAAGYLLTGVGLRSRLFLLIGLLHLLAIGLLPHAPTWQPLITGVVISGSAFLLAELQWDANGVCGYQPQTLGAEPTERLSVEA